MQSFKQYIDSKIENKKIVIFGIGGFGMMTAEEFLKRGYQVEFFVDNDEAKNGTSFRNITCISFRDFLVNKDKYIGIIAVGEPKSLIVQLTNYDVDFIVMTTPYRFTFDEAYDAFEEKEINMQIRCVESILEDEKSKNILNVLVQNRRDLEYSEYLYNEIYEDNQYFPKDLIRLKNETMFVDCGASIGESFEAFLKNKPPDISYSAFLFEMNNDACRKLKDNVEKWCPDNNIHIINKGVSDTNETLSYSSSETSSHLDVNGDKTVSICTIDSELNDKDVTFIKMDIEGYELKALMGGVETIRRCHPDLAICIYHKMEDIWEIPLWIKNIDPHYKIYIRHHTHTMIETVCYALYEEV